MTAPEGVLVDVQRRLEGFYGLPPQPPVTEFLIPPGATEQYPGDGSRTLEVRRGQGDGDGLFTHRAAAAGTAVVGAALPPAQRRE